ncbi:MAG: peptidylprolyl isomerase [Candidatus Methanomethylophilaceae archaeon]|nr:peptidylprolyl isomerase [Candidatus Methanomethylophilaceae archaeon]
MMADAKKLVRLTYKAYLADADERLYDTTDADAAKEAGIFNEKITYAPMAYLFGSKTLFPDLEAAIEAAEIGKETTVTIPCEKAAGARNPKLIELHPIKEFYKQEINPYPGMSVSLGNRNGVIMSVAAGRVKVDFNNQLAGHDLKYIFTVTEEITEDKAKALAIIELTSGTSEGFDVAIEDKKVVVTEAETCKFDQNWAIAKYKIVADLRAAFGVERVDFVQVWESGKKEDKKE